MIKHRHHAVVYIFKGTQPRSINESFCAVKIVLIYWINDAIWCLLAWALTINLILRFSFSALWCSNHFGLHTICFRIFFFCGVPHTNQMLHIWRENNHQDSSRFESNIHFLWIVKIFVWKRSSELHFDRGSYSNVVKNVMNLYRLNSDRFLKSIIIIIIYRINCFIVT